MPCRANRLPADTRSASAARPGRKPLWAAGQAATHAGAMAPRAASNSLASRVFFRELRAGFG